MYPRKLRVRGRRRTIRLSSTALAFAALATLISAGQAQAAGGTYDMYDYNADGWIDASALDWNGDGWLDRNFVDVNADGFGDIWLIDDNENRVVDQFVVDSAPQDGRSDHWFLDTNEDGAIDATYVDVDGNGTADIPEGTVPVVQPAQPYVNPACAVTPGGCRYGSGANTGGSVALPPDVSIATGLDNIDSAANDMSGVG